MQTIIIWEMEPERIHALRANAESALKSLGMRANIQINCEEPLVSRNGLLGKLPAIQLAGEKKVWSRGYGRVISAGEFEGLFAFLLGEKNNQHL